MLIMDTLIKKEEVKEVASNIPLFSEQITEVLMNLFRLNKINQIYSNCYNHDAIHFIESVLSELKVNIDFNEEELDNIPLEGAFISVSNHPYGGLDGLILLLLILKKRPDFRVMANYLLKRIEPINDKIIPVNPFDHISKSNFKGMKEALTHIKNGLPLGIFPSGEVSTYTKNSKGVTDKIWSKDIVKLIKKAEVPVLPIYFEGTNSLLFHFFGFINPLFRSAKLPSELFNKKNKPIKVIIGAPISVDDQKQFENTGQFGRYLRTRTYALGSTIEVKKFYKNPALNFPRKPKQISSFRPIYKINRELDKIREHHLLFEINNYEAFCAPSFKIPNILHQIGVLREITFRNVGEGTNKNIDLDEYDLYYKHLFLWDKENDRIVGSYRIGSGDEILEKYGKKGFYTNTLFKLNDKLQPVLNESLELGRSFIVPQYQQKRLPLFLLWKGILYYLLKNPQYRYLIGPVSISNQYSDFSKQLIIEFIKSNYYDYDLAALVQPRHEFNPNLKDDLDLSTILSLTKNDISRLDKYIKEIDNSNLPIPVLLKKYIKQNAKIIGFNLDPKFNNCLDGLMVLDLHQVPEKLIYSLSEEFKDKMILSFRNRKITY